MGKKILIVSQYFYPENFRINDIAKEWVKIGHEVTVITGIPNYPEGKFYKGYSWAKRRSESIHDIKIIRLPIFSRGKSKLKLITNYISFVFSGYIWKLKTKLKFDLIFVYEVSPMTQALPGIWLGKKLKIPVILYVTDLWPENVEIVAGVKNKFVLKQIGKMVDYIYAKSKLILTSSDSFIDSISSRGVSKLKLKYWPQYAEDVYHPFRGSNLMGHLIPNDGRLNIIFTGNIGYAQGLDLLPKVAQKLKLKQIIVRFNIVGEGRFKKPLIELVEEYGVKEYFNFIDKQSSENIPKLLSLCDCGLIILNENPLFSMTIPAKTQSYLACGIPILASVDGEVFNLVNQNKIGIATKAGDEMGLVEAIVKFSLLNQEEINEFRKNALNYNENNFSKTKLLNQMELWFEQVIQERQ